MFCTNCGTQLNGERFCPNCGTPTQVAPAQQAPQQTQAQAPAPAPVSIPVPVQQQPVQQQSPIQQPVQQPVQQQPIQQQVSRQVQPRAAQPQQWQQPAPWQPRQKKNSPALKIVSVLLAVLLMIQLGVAGFVRPGWFRGSKAVTPNYRMDGKVMELTLPALSKAQEEVYQAGSNATQAYYTARLNLERLLKAAEDGVTGSALESLVDRTVESFRVADKISAYTERMASALEKTENTAKAKAGSILAGLDLSIHASAAESVDPELLKWAQEITELYDKAPAGRQVRTLAEQLGMDAKHAFEVIKQSQAIMKGKYESDADIANYWYETCMKTKTACKVIVVTTAIISSGGAAGAAGSVGLVDGALLTASGVDAIVEVGDTTVNIVAGEGSQLQAEYGKMKDKIAPITGVAGAAGLFVGGWSTAVDKAGQLIYISDSVHDLVENGKIAGIQLPGTGPAPGETTEQTVKMVKLPPADGNTTPEEVKETLEKIGVPPEQAEKIAEAVTEEPEDTPPADEDEPSIGDVMDLDELSDEELDQLLEELLAMEELEQEFDELFESFDEDIPVEDLPQEGDDEGFDNPENWVQPQNPGEIEPEPEPSSEVEDDEDEDDEDDEDENDEDEEDEEDEEDDIYDLICGNYAVTETVVSEYYDGESETETYSLTFVVSRDGTSMFIGNAGQTPVAMQFDPDSLTGTVDNEGDTITFTFTVDGDSVSLYGTGTVSESWYFDTYTYSGRKTN